MNLIRKLQTRKQQPMEGRSQPLNIKDTAAFQSALALYEKKEYKKSLEEVNEIISRRKEKIHGESLCLKALDLYHLNQDLDESARLMEQGTKIDAKSPVAWHMAGIYHKLRRDFAEAYKSYLQSYRLKRENMNVNEDLAMLAAQQRDYDMLVEVRSQALAKHMSLRMAWVAAVAAQYLKGNYLEVEKLVVLYEQVLNIEKDNKPVKQGVELLAEQIEVSELLMLRNRAILNLNKDAKRVLANLDEIKHKVRDQLAWSENRALALSRLAKQDPQELDKAKQAYFELIERNSENVEYYKALESFVSDHVALYDELAAKFPKADMPQARPLIIFDADSQGYSDRVQRYLESKLKRQVPSTFMLMEPLYREDSKRQVMIDVVENKLKLDSNGKQDPCTAIYVARHLSYTGRQTKAIELLEKLIKEDMPNEEDADIKVDVSLAYAEVLQNGGAFSLAAEELLKASESMPGDRYLNTKAASAAFRAGDIDKGYKLVFQFPKAGKHAENDQDAMEYLVTMESVNVVVDAAEAHHRCQEHGLALKRATQAMDIIHTYYREQYDFHYYGPRRGTLRAYTDMVHWYDDLYSHPQYFLALKVATAELIAFNRHEPDGLSEKELAAAKRHRTSQLETLDLTKDKDVFGLAALESKTGLQTLYDAYKYIETSTAHAKDPEAWLIGFQILLAMKKYVLAMQTLKKASEFGATTSQICAAGLMARHTLERDSSAAQALRGLQLKMLPTIVTQGNAVDSDPVEYANTYVTDLLSWIRVRQFIDAVDGVEPKVVDRISELKEVNDVQSVYIELRRAGASEEFTKALKQKWPRASFA